MSYSVWGPQRFPLGQTSSQPSLLTTCGSLQRPHIIFSLYTDEDTEAPRFQATCPGQSGSTATLSAARVDGGLAWSGLPPLPVGSEAHTLHGDPASQRWQSTEKEFLSLDSQTQMRLTGLHSFPWANTCFCGKTTQRSWHLHTVFRSGLHGPCGPRQIIEPWPHAAGRGLGVVSAGASQPHTAG